LPGLILIILAIVILVCIPSSFTLTSRKSKHVKLAITPAEIAEGGSKKVVIKHWGIPQKKYLPIPEEISELEDMLYQKRGFKSGLICGDLLVRWKVQDGTSRYRRVIIDKALVEKQYILKIAVADKENEVIIPRGSKSGDIFPIEKLTKLITNKKGVTAASKTYIVIEVDTGIDQFKEQLITKNDLGKEVYLAWNNKNYAVRIPNFRKREFTMRLAGLGTVKYKRRGDLLVKFEVDYGKDLHKEIWISEREAIFGIEKKITIENTTHNFIVPARTRHRDIIRIPDAGTKVRSVRGDLVITINVYPDDIVPPTIHRDINVDHFVREQIAFLQTIFDFELPPPPLAQVIENFERRGVEGVSQLFIKYLNLNSKNIQIVTKDNLGAPGNCRSTCYYKKDSFGNTSEIHYQHVITIDRKFVSKPFPLAYIIGHELSHVYLGEKLEYLSPLGSNWSTRKFLPDKDKEKQADIFTIMMGIGLYWELARREGILLGYFSSFAFENIWAMICLVFGTWKSTRSGMVFWRSPYTQ